MKHKNLFYLFVVICIFVLFAGCSDFFGGNFTTDIQFKINLNDLQLNSRSTTPANEVAKLSVELISQDNSVSLKQEQNIIDNTTDYFTFKNIKVGTIIKINATISQEDKELYVGETEWLDVKPNSNLISLVLEKIYYPESKVTLTFDSNGGSSVEAITGIPGETFTRPTNPTKTGYTFDCWEPELPEVFPEEDATFTALWTPNTYTVTFHANGGTGEMTPQTFTYNEEQVLSENTFTLDDHDFHGWNTKSDGSGTSYEDGASVKNLTAENNGTVKLYAQWIEKVNAGVDIGTIPEVQINIDIENSNNISFVFNLGNETITPESFDIKIYNRGELISTIENNSDLISEENNIYEFTLPPEYPTSENYQLVISCTYSGYEYSETCYINGTTAND